MECECLARSIFKSCKRKKKSYLANKCCFSSSSSSFFPHNPTLRFHFILLKFYFSPPNLDEYSLISLPFIYYFIVKQKSKINTFNFLIEFLVFYFALRHYIFPMITKALDKERERTTERIQSILK